MDLVSLRQVKTSPVVGLSKPDSDNKSGTEGWLFSLGATGRVLPPPENAHFKECTQHKCSHMLLLGIEKGSKELWREKKPRLTARQAVVQKARSNIS